MLFFALKRKWSSVCVCQLLLSMGPYLECAAASVKKADFPALSCHLRLASWVRVGRGAHFSSLVMGFCLVWMCAGFMHAILYFVLIFHSFQITCSNTDFIPVYFPVRFDVFNTTLRTQNRSSTWTKPSALFPPSLHGLDHSNRHLFCYY